MRVCNQVGAFDSWPLAQDNPFEFNVGYYYVRASDPKVTTLKTIACY